MTSSCLKRVDLSKNLLIHENLCALLVWRVGCLPLVKAGMLQSLQNLSYYNTGLYARNWLLHGRRSQIVPTSCGKSNLLCVLCSGWLYITSRPVFVVCWLFLHGWLVKLYEVVKSSYSIITIGMYYHTGTSQCRQWTMWPGPSLRR